VRAFADHFSRLATGYAVYRPRYPDGLFAAIAGASARRDRAWDCATGSGQAATGLARYFRSVVASDASGSQVRAAAADGRVRYAVARAESVPLRRHSIDVVTVAQALHWIDLSAFYAEVRRVLRPGGLLVAWTYSAQRIDDGSLDDVLADFYHRVIGPDWPPERRLVETGYRTLLFPFDEVAIASPPMVAEWSLAQLLGYLGTWSAVAACRERTGLDPLPELAERLAPLWGDPAAPRRVEWSLGVRAGR
jgi:SAM-dependent methyltransferase